MFCNVMLELFSRSIMFVFQGYDSAGVTPYLAAHGFGGKIPEQPQISPETKPGVSSEVSN